MVSLGKLSAGLAHELNNPASAIERSAALLEERLDEAEQATLRAGRSQADRRATRRHRRGAHVLPRDASMHGVLSPIQQAEREEAIADWLADHGVDDRHRRTARRNGRDARGARSHRAGDQRPAARGGPAVGRGRVLGPEHRLGDSGGGDADLRAGHGHQGLHAHGPGGGGRARGPDVEPWQHGRGARRQRRERNPSP